MLHSEMFKLKDITGEVIQQRGFLTHEPRWMRKDRELAWQKFNELEYPDWRKENLEKIDLERQVRLVFPPGDIAPLQIGKKPPAGCAGQIVLHDGVVHRISLKPELAYAGVIFCDMQTALLERADLLDRFLIKSDWGVSDKLTAFHRALWENGYFLFIPKGLKVLEPFEVQVVQMNDRESLLHRNVIVLDESAQASVQVSSESSLQDSEQKPEQHSVCAVATEVFVEKEGTFRYVSMQEWGSTVYDLTYQRIYARENARVQALFPLLGAGAGRSVMTGVVLEKGAAIHHDGIFVAGDQKRFKIVAELEHRAEDTEGMMKYSGMLKDEASNYLDGLIRILPLCRRSLSRLEEHTLLLSPKARCDALPALDIQTDEVDVSHSASVSRADEEKIFYLMSRGLSDAQARSLMVQGFFERLLEQVHDPRWADRIRQTIQSQLAL